MIPGRIRIVRMENSFKKPQKTSADASLHRNLTSQSTRYRARR